jgi:hypothetical protein
MPGAALLDYLASTRAKRLDTETWIPLWAQPPNGCDLRGC